MSILHHRGRSHTLSRRHKPQTARRRPFQRALAGVGLLLTGACGGAAADLTPEGTLKAYARALERGDARAAHALLVPETRKRVDLKELERQMRAYPEERKLHGHLLSGDSVGVVQRARVTLTDGSEVELAREGDGWRIATPSPLSYDQSSPRAALLSFLSALRHQRWDRLLALMPDAARQGLTAAQLGENMRAQREELSRLLALLEASQQAPIEHVGERATMPYGERFAVRFIKEGDLWKIEDPE